MSNFSTIVIIGIVSILLLLLLAGLVIGPASAAPQEPSSQPGDPGSPTPPAEGDRRAGGPGFRSQALALAQRDAGDTPRRRRRRARQARALSAAQSTAIVELGDATPENGVSSSRSARSSAPE